MLNGQHEHCYVLDISVVRMIVELPGMVGASELLTGHSEQTLRLPLKYLLVPLFI